MGGQEDLWIGDLDEARQFLNLISSGIRAAVSSVKKQP
jgi:hypothetical protein